MKKIKIALILMKIICILSLMAQPRDKGVDLSQRLRIGDLFIPPSSVELMRTAEATIDWNALSDKVILLDLFETSCGTCIQMMPHLQELQKKHQDIFKIYIVTPQDQLTMSEFFKNNKYLNEHHVHLPVIYNDKYFRKLFPYKSIPQAVLLYKGKVHAITTTGFITSDNILKLHKEGSLSVPLKDDFGSTSLIQSTNKEDIKAGVLFSGYQNTVNYQPWKFELDSVSGKYKSTWYNGSMYSALLSLASKAQLLDKLYLPRMDRVVWKVRDSTIYKNFTNMPTDVWLADHAISYERYDIIQRPDSIQACLILKDFESFHRVKVYVGLKKMPCLVLKQSPVVSYTGPDVGRKMSYRGSTVVSLFLDYIGKFPPAVDEANVNTKIELGVFKSLDELNKQLASYGLKGEIEDRNIKVFVVEELGL